MTIGAIVHARRNRLGWTQQELAEKAGINQGLVSRVESDKSENITIDNLRGIARAFGCGVVDLLPEEDRRPPYAKPKGEEEDTEVLPLLTQGAS